MTKCKQCNADYKPIRATSLFCSTYCRIKYNRLSVSEVSVSDKDKVSVSKLSVSQDIPKVSVPITDISLMDKPLERPLTPNEKSGITHPGKCHACNKDVSHLRCLCLECLNEGITHKSLGIDIKRCEES